MNKSDKEIGGLSDRLIIVVRRKGSENLDYYDSLTEQNGIKDAP